MKESHILAQVMRQTTSCAGHRQIAHNLGVGPDSIDRALGRPGRHCMLVHLDLWRGSAPAGPVVIDGLETFEWSRFFPFHANIAVEVHTGFVLWPTGSELRRTGRMTLWQAKRRAHLEQTLGLPDPKAVRRGISALLEAVFHGAGSAVVRSDAHPAYRAPIREQRCRIRHEATSTRRRRDGSNALFERNLLDLWIRHGGASHKRETIAWSRRRQRAPERPAIVLVDRNHLRYYRGLVKTRVLRVNREPRLKYAY